MKFTNRAVKFNFFDGHKQYAMTRDCNCKQNGMNAVIYINHQNVSTHTNCGQKDDV